MPNSVKWFNRPMSENQGLTARDYERTDEYVRIGNIAVAKAQAESRRLGVPNVYCINGRIYYELPSGELSLTNPNDKQ